ncbi:hypothetical protein [Corynebacterium doosanense]|nr:hypothetical protein [Corynebacterium doosanense]
METLIEQYLNPELDPVMEALEKLTDDRVSQKQKLSSAMEAAEQLAERVTEVEVSVVGLTHLSEQQQQLAERLRQLSQTTVGTEEYDTAQRAVAETISSLVTMISSMGPALRSVQGTLADLALMYKATLEVAEHPVKLSAASTKNVSQGLSKQISMSLKSELGPLVNQSFARVQESIDGTVNRAVERLQRERALLTKELGKVSQERQKIEESIRKDTDRINNTKRFALWTVLAALLVGAGFVAIGSLGVGAMNFLGIPDGLGTLWSNVASAETWYSTVGWLVVTLAVMGLIVSPMAYVAAKVVSEGK